MCRRKVGAACARASVSHLCLSPSCHTRLSTRLTSSADKGTGDQYVLVFSPMFLPSFAFSKYQSHATYLGKRGRGEKRVKPSAATLSVFTCVTSQSNGGRPRPGLRHRILKQAAVSYTREAHCGFASQRARKELCSQDCMYVSM